MLPAGSPDSKAILEALNTSVSFNQINMVSLLHYLVSGWVNENTSDRSAQVVRWTVFCNWHGLRKKQNQSS